MFVVSLDGQDPELAKSLKMDGVMYVYLPTLLHCTLVYQEMFVSQPGRSGPGTCQIPQDGRCRVRIFTQTSTLHSSISGNVC